MTCYRRIVRTLAIPVPLVLMLSAAGADMADERAWSLREEVVKLKDRIAPTEESVAPYKAFAAKDLVLYTAWINKLAETASQIAKDYEAGRTEEAEKGWRGFEDVNRYGHGVWENRFSIRQRQAEFYPTEDWFHARTLEAPPGGDAIIARHQDARLKLSDAYGALAECIEWKGDEAVRAHRGHDVEVARDQLSYVDWRTERELNVLRICRDPAVRSPKLDAAQEQIRTFFRESEKLADQRAAVAKRERELQEIERSSFNALRGAYDAARAERDAAAPAK